MSQSQCRDSLQWLLMAPFLALLLCFYEVAPVTCVRYGAEQAQVL